MKKRLLFALVVLMGMLLLSASIVWAAPAPVAKTGQTTSLAYGDDGDYEKGVTSPNPRFTNHFDGTVTDNLTGLMWAQNANLVGELIWYHAILNVNDLSLGSNGCGTSYTDWRLPNVRELQSLIDFGIHNPALPSGHPFLNVQSDYYWTSTTSDIDGLKAWYVNMGNGNTYYVPKDDGFYVWPVRGGNLLFNCLVYLIIYNTKAGS
jgi:hypothetical protein